MNCDIIRDLMPLYADDQASDATRFEIDAHTARCPACRKTLRDMCAPLEPEPEDKTEQIMEMVWRRQRRIKIRNTLLVILAILIALWGLLELRYDSRVIYSATDDREKILKEVPELALSEAELALVDTIFEIPEIREALSDSYDDTTTLDHQALAPYFSSICPEGSRITDISVMGPDVVFSIFTDNTYTLLIYTDVDRTGHIDQVTKTYAVYPKGIVDENGFLGETDTVYELFYAIGGMTKCQKIKSRHQWFSFWDIWFG